MLIPIAARWWSWTDWFIISTAVYPSMGVTTLLVQVLDCEAQFHLTDVCTFDCKLKTQFHVRKGSLLDISKWVFTSRGKYLGIHTDGRSFFGCSSLWTLREILSVLHAVIKRFVDWVQQDIEHNVKDWVHSQFQYILNSLRIILVSIYVTCLTLVSFNYCILLDVTFYEC